MALPVFLLPVKLPRTQVLMTHDSGLEQPSSLPQMTSKFLGRFHITLPSDIIQKIIETFSTRVLLIVFSLATSIIIARSLGPEGRGLYALAITIGALGVQFTNMGLHSSNTFYVARDPNLLSPLLGNSLLISFSMGGLCAVSAGLIFHTFPELAPVQGPILYMALAWIPFGLAYLLNQNLMLGIQETRSFNKLEIYNKTISLILILAVILSGWVSPSSLFATSFLALLICFIWTFPILNKHLSRPIHLSRSLFGKYLPYGIKAYLGSLVGFLLLRVDMLMINQMLDKKDVGLYDIAISMSDMVYLFPMVVSTILFPKLSGISNIQQKWNLSKNTGIAMLIIMAVICIGVAALSSPLIHLLYGKLFMGSVPVFVVLIICKFLMAANSIFSIFIASIYVPWATVPFNFSTLGVNIILNYYWIEQYGIVGAAMSSIVCFLLLIAFHFYYTRKYLRSGPPATQ
jgi:O-antigen/teichoic acid export membrane protein